MCISNDNVSVTITPRIFILLNLVTPSDGGGTLQFPILVRGLCMISSTDLELFNFRLFFPPIQIRAPVPVQPCENLMMGRLSTYRPHTYSDRSLDGGHEGLMC